MVESQTRRRHMEKKLPRQSDRVVRMGLSKNISRGGFFRSSCTVTLRELSK